MYPLVCNIMGYVVWGYWIAMRSSPLGTFGRDVLRDDMLRRGSEAEAGVGIQSVGRPEALVARLAEVEPRQPATRKCVPQAKKPLNPRPSVGTVI